MTMDIVVEVGDKAKVEKATSKQRKQLDALCELLTDKYPKLWLTGKNVVKDTEKVPMRVDNQGVLSNPFAGQNLQAQTGSISIAAVGLANTLSNPKMPPACQTAVENAVKEALKASAADQKWRYVKGTCT
ncbi:hypothetical protein [Embleya sp. NPDC005971]|uniref:hypothetical protein n=1 Tax=Embleya sp. NPDC005971 TaxID=3156724 RepID=UPI0033E28D20